jgi:hypothetical protein
MKKFLLNVFVIASVAFVVPSCNEDETLPTEYTESSSNESVLESTTDELDDLAAIALNSQDQAAGGRISTIDDDRMNCDGTTVTFSNVSTDHTSGTVTIAFGPDGCTDDRGNVRKGTITINWTGGKWFRQGSTQTMTLQDYSINGIAIGGTRTLNCSMVSGSLQAFTIQWHLTANHDFTWPDQTIATRVVNKTRTWDHSSTENTFTVTNGPSSENAAQGTNRQGISYSMDIDSPLVYIGSCISTTKVFLPVSGTKLFSNSETGKTVTIDFGDGTCDNKFTVSLDGASKTITAENNGDD